MNYSSKEDEYRKARTEDVPALIAKIEDIREAYRHPAKGEEHKDHFDFLLEIKDALMEYTDGKCFSETKSPKFKALTDTEVDGKPFFLYFIKVAPELAGVFTRDFNGNYDYLRRSDVISYLAMPRVNKAKCATGNTARRKDIMAGREPFPLTTFYRNDKGEIVNSFTSKEVSKISQKKLLRKNVLTPVANYFSQQYLSKWIIKGEDINKKTVLAVQNIIKDYPDILAMDCTPRQGPKTTFGNYIINFDHRNPLDFFPAFANKSGPNEDDYYERIESSYAISPEEVLRFAIKAENEEFIWRFNARNASVFNAQKRINEHIENMAKIAVNNPKYLYGIVAPFLLKTTYCTKKYPSKSAIDLQFQHEADKSGDTKIAKDMKDLLGMIVTIRNKKKFLQTTLMHDFTNSR